MYIERPAKVSLSFGGYPFDTDRSNKLEIELQFPAPMSMQQALAHSAKLRFLKSAREVLGDLILVNMHAAALTGRTYASARSPLPTCAARDL